MSTRLIKQHWHKTWLRILALFGISLAGMSVRADDYEDWLGIG